MQYGLYAQARVKLGLWSGVGIVVANMIGSGVLTTPGFMAMDLAPSHILLAWVVGGVVALSGGYARKEACAKLACNHGVIASFSRALTEGLTAGMSGDAFDAALAEAIDEIYTASVDKHQRSED